MAQDDDYWLGQAALQHSFLAEALTQSGDGLFHCDADGHFIRVNTRCSTLFGHDIRQLIGRHLCIICPGEQQNQLTQRLRRLRRHQQLQFEQECMQGNGNRVLLHVFLQLLPDSSMLGLARDLSPRVELQELADEKFRWELLARSTLDSLPEQLCVLDENGVVVALNRAWRQMTDHECAGLIRAREGSNYLDLLRQVARGDKRAAADVLQGLQLLFSGERQQFELEYHCPAIDCEQWFNMLGVRFFDQRRLRIVIIHSDISARKRTELSLRDSETRYRGIVETAQEGVWVLDIQGHTTFANRSLERILGYSSAELAGKTMVDFMSEDAREQAEHTLGKWSDGLDGEYEFCFMRKDGSAVWTQMQCNALPASAGGWMGVLCMVTDITQRHYSEAALRASEERFLNAFEYAATGMALLGLDGSWLKVNSALGEILGYSSNELFRTELSALVHEEDRALEAPLRRQLLAGKIRYYHLEQRYLHKKGDVLWLLLAVSLVRGNAGEPLHFIVQTQDITARVMAEQASTRHARLQEMLANFGQQALTLNTIEELYEQAVSVAAKALECRYSLLLQLDADGQWAVRAACGFDALAAGQILQPDLDSPTAAVAMHCDLRTQYALADALEAGIGTADQPWGRIGVYSNSVRADSPQDRSFMQSLAMTVASAIERRQAQEARIEYLRLEHKRNQEHFRLAAMLERSKDEVVVIADLQQRIEFVNRTFLALTGWEENEVLGQPLGMLYVAGQDLVEQIWQDLARNKRWRGRFEYQCRQGKPLIVEGSLSPVRDNQNRVTAYVTVATDITVRQQLESRALREEKLKSLGYMAAGIAHDFNNILNVILGNAELASLDLPANSLGSDNLQQVAIAVERGRTLVEQMLTFARQERPRFGKVSLGQLAQETAKLMRPGLPSNIVLSVQADPAAPHIVADPVQLRQIILNLATNAIHALRPAGGTLDIRVQPLPHQEGELDHVQLEVRDSGCGMEPDVIDRIFDPFFSTREVGEGTGLGLSVVHGIVEHHGGHVRVQSEPGKGSCFTVVLPVIPPYQPPAEAGDSPPATAAEQ